MQVIYETLVGSHLYGTNTPESDLDIAGVFIPSKREMLGLSAYPLEHDSSRKISEGPRNAAGDVDCKHYSLRRFLQLISQGQPGALEILFSNPIDARICTSTWMTLIDVARQSVLSKKGIAPFLGFAQSQAEKMVRRGEKYNQITSLLNVLMQLTGDGLSLPLEESVVWVTAIQDYDATVHTNDHGYRQLRFAGSDYDVGISLRTFKKQLQRKEERYGARSKAAALEHLDYKALLHCMRLLTQAEEYLNSGTITFPRPDRDFLMTIKRREWPPEGYDVFEEVSKSIERIRKHVTPRSKLPDIPNLEWLEEFCIQVHEAHLNGVDICAPWPTEIRTSDESAR